MAGGALQVPANPAVLGWWRDGAEPGAPDGRVVIDGHVDSAAAGPGALFELDTVAPGAEVRLTTGTAVVAYRVVARSVYDKGHLPTGLFDSAGPSLVIVTCGGPFDHATHHYLQNVVVYGIPAE